MVAALDDGNYQTRIIQRWIMISTQKGNDATTGTQLCRCAAPALSPAKTLGSSPAPTDASSAMDAPATSVMTTTVPTNSVNVLRGRVSAH